MGLWRPDTAAESLPMTSSGVTASVVVVAVKSSVAWRREAKPAAAVGTGGLKPVLDKFDGEDASDDARDGFGEMNFAAGAGSGSVVTLPCLE